MDDIYDGINEYNKKRKRKVYFIELLKINIVNIDILLKLLLILIFY